MIRSPKKFDSCEAAKLFVEQCESDFEQRLSDTVAKVCAHNDIKIIGLSGPTCSGKTTAAKKLIKYLGALGKKVHIVSIDDFYLDRDVLLARTGNLGSGTIDYDSEDTIDFDELRRCITQVFTDEPTLIPRFDFIEGKRMGYETVSPSGDDLFIFEGIQAIYPKVTALFHQFSYKSVYISVESGIDVDGTIFEPDELRLIRRIVRDYNFRGATPEFTLYLWESVRANEELNIFPNVGKCDYFINSTLPFEVNLLAPYLRKILPEVPPDNNYKTLAGKLLAKIDGIESVSTDMISDDSLCYEFIKREK